MDNRDIDKLVAEKVMGWKVKSIQTSERSWQDAWRNEDEKIMAWYREWKPSTDISSAWQVFEWLEAHGVVSVSSADDNGKGCTFIPYVFRGQGLRDVSVSASCHPRAICLVALRAVGVEVEGDSDPRP